MAGHRGPLALKVSNQLPARSYQGHLIYGNSINLAQQTYDCTIKNTQMLMGMAKLLLWNANSWTRISTLVVDKDPPPF